MVGSDLHRGGAGDQHCDFTAREARRGPKRREVGRTAGRAPARGGIAGLRPGDLQLLRPPGAQRGEVLPHLAENRRAGQAYFRHLLGLEAARPAGTTWEWLRERSFADDALAAEYLDLLLKQRMTEHAVEVRALDLGRRRDDYPDSNLLFNGDFQNPPTDAALDWRITAVRGAETARDEQCARRGRSSILIRARGWTSIPSS